MRTPVITTSSSSHSHTHSHSCVCRPHSPACGRPGGAQLGAASPAKRTCFLPNKQQGLPKAPQAYIGMCTLNKKAPGNLKPKRSEQEGSANKAHKSTIAWGERNRQLPSVPSVPPSTHKLLHCIVRSWLLTMFYPAKK